MTERSKYEVILDVRYGARYGELNERFYRRLDLLFGFVGLFGGSAVVVGSLGSYPVIAALSGGIVAACAIIERLIRPVEKAIDHGMCKRRFADLDSRATQLSVEDIDTELRRLQMDAPMGISSLAIPTFNANLRSNGREDAVIPETVWQRAVVLLA